MMIAYMITKIDLNGIGQAASPNFLQQIPEDFLRYLKISLKLRFQSGIRLFTFDVPSH